MSRSWMKHPHCAVGYSRGMKKLFNRRIRRSSKCRNIPNGCAYKKVNDTWDMIDYKAPVDYKDMKEYMFEPGLSEKQKRGLWKRKYKSK